jgi:hypothetical protein
MDEMVKGEIIRDEDGVPLFGFVYTSDTTEQNQNALRFVFPVRSRVSRFYHRLCATKNQAS